MDNNKYDASVKSSQEYKLFLNLRSGYYGQTINTIMDKLVPKLKF